MAPSTLKAQLVTGKFTRLAMSENFDTISPQWTTLANAENLFIVQEGEYIISRKTTISPFAIVADDDNGLETFRMVASLNLERSASDQGSIGLIIMAQPGGKGGLLAEISADGEYRVRQITGGAYKNLTGTARSNGWVASRAVNTAGAFNLLDLRTSNGNYDLYINHEFLFSFTETAYRSGRYGLVIGPGTKGRVDFIYLFDSGQAADTTRTDSPGSSPGAGPSVIELAESIISLKTQINKLSEQNNDLRKTIEALQSDDNSADAQIKKHQATIKKLEAQIKRSTASFDSLEAVNASLMKYKEMVAGNENSDLIISLSKSLKAEKEKNELLEQENAALKESAGQAPDSKKKTGNTKTSNSQNSFSLPE